MTTQPDFLALIRADLNQLLCGQQKGDSQMIDLPLATLTDDVVRVWCKALEDGRYVVSDGGWLSDPMRHEDEGIGMEHSPALVEQFRVKFILNPRTQDTLAYLTCDKLELVTSRIFDLAHYIQATIAWRVFKRGNPATTQG